MVNLEYVSHNFCFNFSFETGFLNVAFETINGKYNYMDEQHVEFPDGHPFKYYLHLMMLNFSVRTRTGLFIIEWSFTRLILLLAIMLLYFLPYA